MVKDLDLAIKIRNLCMHKCEIFIIFMQSVYTLWSYPCKQLSAEAAIA